MADISDFRAKIAATVPDKGNRVASVDDDQFIQEAVRQFSRDKPRIRTAFLTGDGTTQTFPAPAGYQPRFSIITLFEHPIDQVPRIERDLQDEITVVELTDGVESIQLITQVLAAAEQARIQFTAPHVVDDSSSSIPDNDFDAVCNLAASKIARAMATFFAEAISTSTMVPADLVNHADKATLFTMLGDRLLKMYTEHVHSGDVSVGAVRHFDTDIHLSHGREPLFHRSRLH